MNPKFLIAYPFGGRNLPCDWYVATRQLRVPTNTIAKEVFSRGLKLDDAQNSFARDALSLDAKYLLLIEDDTIPPPHTICELSRVLDTSDDSVMACGGIYTTRTDPPEPIVYQGLGQGSFWNWKAGDIFPCWAIGMGCTMIRSEVFKMMPQPWFKNYDCIAELAEKPEEFPDKELAESLLKKNPQKWGLTSDLYFFMKLEKMGFKVLAHGGVLPIHFDVAEGRGYWLPENSRPMEAVNT